MPAHEAASIRSSGKETVRKPTSVKSAADTQQSQSAKVSSHNKSFCRTRVLSAQPPKKYEQNASVYDSTEKDGSGRPKRKRYWICCVRWNKSERKWIYKLKDAPYPRGKDIRWVEEHYLHEWHV